MQLSHLIKQKSYEKVEYILRRHWFTFLPKIILFLFLAVVPVLLYFMIQTLYPTLFDHGVVFALGLVFASAFYLSILVFFYTEFIVFYLDMWVVTNDRIVDVEQLGIFSRSISELDLFRIQDVTADVHGAFATLIDYGTVTIKTASNNINIVFKDVKHPNKIREELIQLSHIDRKYHYGQALQSED